MYKQTKEDSTKNGQVLSKKKRTAEVTGKCIDDAPREKLMLHIIIGESILWIRGAGKTGSPPRQKR